MFIKQKTLSFLSLLAVSSFVLSGCTPTTATRGHIVEDVEIADIEPGRDTQRSVIKKIGSPTTISSLDPNTWYYIGMVTEKRGILDPKETNKKIVQVRFNEEGRVADIANIDNENLDIPISREKTATGGNKVTLTQQLLGNMGRFNTGEGQ